MNLVRASLMLSGDLGQGHAHIERGIFPWSWEAWALVTAVTPTAPCDIGLEPN